MVTLVLQHYANARVERYTDILTRYPILALPETDLARYDSAVEALVEQSKKLASFYDGPERSVLEKNLLPVTFLATLSDLEHARRALQTEPTPWRAVRYAALLNTSLRQLEKEARTLALQFARYPHTGDLAFIDGTTDTETLARELAHVASDARLARTRALIHLRCIIVDSAACKVDWENRLVQPLPFIEKDELDKVQPLLSVVQETQSGLSNYTPHMQKLVHAKSRCATESDPLTLMWYRTDTQGNRIRSHEPLSDLLVIDYTQIPRSNTTEESPRAIKQRRRGVSPRMHEWFLTEGVTYLYQPMGGLYYCLESGFDVATQARLLGLYDLMQDAPPTSGTDSAQLVRLGELRSIFLNTPAIEETAADELMHEVARLLQQEPPSAAQTSYLKNIVLVWHAETYHFDETLRAIHEHNLFILAALEKGENFPVATLLSMRSYPSVTFFMANENLYPTERSLLKSSKRFTTEQFGIRKFSELQFTVGREKLTEALAQGFGVMSRLLSGVR